MIFTRTLDTMVGGRFFGDALLRRKNYIGAASSSS